MLRKVIILVGACLTLFLLWFANYNYRQAASIAEENLRGLALSIAAAIEHLALQDPKLAALTRFHPDDVAYFALLDRHGIYRFHSNPDLIGTSAAGSKPPEGEHPSTSGNRVTLGTGEKAFRFASPIYLPTETLTLQLTLHTYRADSVIRTALLNATILLGLLVAGWILAAILVRYARREELLHLEMARKENLARLGEMGAMLAHEIRNPLSGVKGFAQVIAKRPTEERNAGFAQKIVAEVVRLENLVSELLAYASSDPRPVSEVDLPALARHVVSLLSAEAVEQGVEIVSDFPDKLRVSGNADRLEQVLLNLGKNALQAMPDGGTFHLGLQRFHNKAVITAKDTGQGIPALDLPKVFEPLFTTKARGTGLGLSLCRKIAEEHQGAIELTSAVGEGTIVTFTLPLGASS